MSMRQTVYTVPENEGDIFVCAMVVNGSRCPIDFEFSFVMSTQMGLAGIYVLVQSCAYIQPLNSLPPSLPSSFPPSLPLSLSVLGEDYNHTVETVTMRRCARIACTTVVIINDKSVEHIEESFSVNLETNFTLIPQIRFEDTQTVVTITDNDGICINTFCTILSSMYVCKSRMFCLLLINESISIFYMHTPKYHCALLHQ